MLLGADAKSLAKAAMIERHVSKIPMLQGSWSPLGSPAGGFDCTVLTKNGLPLVAAQSHEIPRTRDR